MVSILNDDGDFLIPNEIPLKLSLLDILEKDKVVKNIMWI